MNLAISTTLSVLTPDEEAMAVRPSWVRAVKALRERVNLSLTEAVEIIKSYREAFPDKVLEAAKTDVQGGLENAAVQVRRLERELKAARAHLATLRRQAKKMAKS